MYPDLSYILHDLIGTQPDNAFSVVKTFGLFLVIAILVAAYFFAKELERKDQEGLFEPIISKVTLGKPASPISLFLNGLLGFFIGFKFFYVFSNFPDFQADPAAVIFSLKGINETMSWIGGLGLAAIFVWIKYQEKQKTKLPEPKETTISAKPHERIGDITVVSVLSGIIGAKLFAMIEDLDMVFSGKISFSYWLSQFFSGSGMAIYGGLILGFLGGYIYLKYLKIRPLPVLDAVAPALMISYGVGRLGCHFSGDGDWGIVNTAAKPGWIPQFLWSYDYPHNVINESANSVIEGCQWHYCNVLAEAVYPTPLYEFIMALGIFLLLWFLRKRIKTVGVIFFTYVFLNGVERFLIEKIRVNDKYDWFFNLTQAEMIALGLMLIGIIGAAVVWRNGGKQEEGVS
jgi:phosphatidylglycerol---prolipoprotein diacylglyceryl transferase